MKFFIDSANLDDIKEALAMGMCDGVTTNPSLCAKEGRQIEPCVKEIARIVDGPISGEVISTDYKGMVKEGEKISQWAENMVVKIPMTVDGLKAVKELEEKGIKTNCTLIFSANQALMAAKAGASYVSPFVGRLDDIGEDGMKLIEDIVQIYKNYGFETEVIVASVRSGEHVRRSAVAGAHIATIPLKVVKELAQHDLTDKGLAKFLEDYKKVSK
ncbi:MAG: fructose-6-phosphate aldolase [archaeon]